MLRLRRGTRVPAVDVLVVCTANHTRSPYVAAELHRRTGARLTVASAGISALPSRRGADQLLLDLLGIESPVGPPLRDHRPRRLTTGLVSGAALVLTATREHRGLVDAIAPGATARTWTLLELAAVLQRVDVSVGCGLTSLVDGLVPRRGSELLADSTTDLRDPYGEPAESYRLMVRRVADALDTVAPALLAATQHLTEHPC